MCFDITNKTKRIRLTRDVFFLKKSNPHYVTPMLFTSRVINFIYTKGKVYTKSWWNRLKVRWYSSEDQVEGEAFHIFSLSESKLLIKHPLYMCGIFKVKKGSIIYINIHTWGTGGTAICFNIEYIGPVTEENKHLITEQEGY